MNVQLRDGWQFVADEYGRVYCKDFPTGQARLIEQRDGLVWMFIDWAATEYEFDRADTPIEGGFLVAGASIGAAMSRMDMVYRGRK